MSLFKLVETHQVTNYKAVAAAELWRIIVDDLNRADVFVQTSALVETHLATSYKAVAAVELCRQL